jgi:hypothetical protein
MFNLSLTHAAIPACLKQNTIVLVPKNQWQPVIQGRWGRARFACYFDINSSVCKQCKKKSNIELIKSHTNRVSFLLLE